MKLELATMTRVELNILILLLISNGQVVASFTFLPHPVSVGQVHTATSAAEPHLLAAGLWLVCHLTLHVGRVTVIQLTHYMYIHDDGIF